LESNQGRRKQKLYGVEKILSEHFLLAQIPRIWFPKFT